MRTAVFFSFFILTGIFFTQCHSTDNQPHIDLSNISVSMKSVRFDSLFFHTQDADFTKLKREFPYLFPTSTPDSVWVKKQTDTLETEIFSAVNQVFTSTQQEDQALTSLFQHIKYYFSDFHEPKVIYLTSEVDYQNRVIYADSLLLIGLDNYLGESHYFYQNIQEYIRREFQRENIPVDVAQEIASRLVPESSTNAYFLDALVEEGKKYYLMSLFLPQIPTDKLLKYTEDEYHWAQTNESDIWRYFIDNELLYSTDKKLLNRFIYPVPFSKFYLDLDSESPGRIGAFIGLQIVLSYVKHHHTPLHEMLQLSAEELFSQAHYKPQRQ